MLGGLQDLNTTPMHAQYYLTTLPRSGDILTPTLGTPGKKSDRKAVLRPLRARCGGATAHAKKTWDFWSASVDQGLLYHAFFARPRPGVRARLEPAGAFDAYATHFVGKAKPWLVPTPEARRPLVPFFFFFCQVLVFFLSSSVAIAHRFSSPSSLPPAPASYCYEWQSLRRHCTSLKWPPPPSPPATCHSTCPQWLLRRRRFRLFLFLEFFILFNFK